MKSCHSRHGSISPLTAPLQGQGETGEELVPYSELNTMQKTDGSAVGNLMFLSLCHLASDPWLMWNEWVVMVQFVLDIFLGSRKNETKHGNWYQPLLLLAAFNRQRTKQNWRLKLPLLQNWSQVQKEINHVYERESLQCLWLCHSVWDKESKDFSP